MPTYTSSISIAANAAPVWQALSDVVRWPEWLHTVTAVEALDAPALATGRRFRIVQPRLRPAVWTVSALNPPLAFAWTSASPGLRVRAEHTVEAVAPGQAPGQGRCRWRRRLQRLRLGLPDASLRLQAIEPLIVAVRNSPELPITTRQARQVAAGHPLKRIFALQAQLLYRMRLERRYGRQQPGCQPRDTAS